jgi:hypothetical protein
VLQDLHVKETLIILFLKNYLIVQLSFTKKIKEGIKVYLGNGKRQKFATTS